MLWKLDDCLIVLIAHEYRITRSMTIDQLMQTLRTLLNVFDINHCEESLRFLSAISYLGAALMRL